MKRIIATFLLVAIATTAFATCFQQERLNYKVLFKWGLIHKQAGRATLTLKKSGTDFTAILYARSESWADHFYSVRDTLISTMSPNDMLPKRYERIAHEGGNYARDIISIIRSGDIFTGSSTRYRKKKKNSDIKTTNISLTAQGPTVDMLSVFYYIRTIDFKSKSQGYHNTINIFSGKRKELLKIKYIGRETIDIDGVKYDTYKLSFTFLDEKSQKSSDDIITWIWTDSSHIPLKLEGKLKIGKIRCIYIGNGE